MKYIIIDKEVSELLNIMLHDITDLDFLKLSFKRNTSYNENDFDLFLNECIEKGYIIKGTIDDLFEIDCKAF